jgi:hypothetical protein
VTDREHIVLSIDVRVGLPMGALRARKGELAAGLAPRTGRRRGRVLRL